ncbi:RluA family pseudouridine synthase [Candidatus Peregrinibacteria bacterium]|nr:RluA family pseudouridine synthase [Candidatus Peregrinibacteria bacterium]
MPISRDRVLHCDDAILAVNKLAGELVVKGAGNVQRLPMLDFLKKEYPGIHPLNRLDFETSGVVVFARNKTVLACAIKSKFSGWKKVYRTIVAGRIEDNHGEINMPLPARAKGDGNPSLRSGQVYALTRFAVLARFEGSTYVEVEIETGRHHQIRRHFQMIHHPLVLDALYGDEKFNRKFSKYTGYRRFFLHALRVSLPHPITGKEITIEAEMPKVFEEALKKL